MAEGTGPGSDVLCHLSHCYYLHLIWFEGFYASIATGGKMSEQKSRQLLSEHDRPVRRRPVQLEYVLRQIDADDGNLSMDAFSLTGC